MEHFQGTIKRGRYAHMYIAIFILLLFSPPIPTQNVLSYNVAHYYSPNGPN